MTQTREWLKHPYEVEGEGPWADRPHKKLGFPVDTVYGTVYIAPLAKDRIRIDASADGYRIQIPTAGGAVHNFAVSALYVQQPEGTWLETESGLHASADHPIRKSGDYFQERELAPGQKRKLTEELRQLVSQWAAAHPEQLIAAEKVELNNNAFRLEGQINEKQAEIDELQTQLDQVARELAELTLESVEHGRGLDETDTLEHGPRPHLDNSL